LKIIEKDEFPLPPTSYEMIEMEREEGTNGGDATKKSAPAAGGAPPVSPPIGFPPLHVKLTKCSCLVF
jgi:hypothetical protein